MDLLLAFTIGLLSTLHCIGMCGGIAAALSLSTRPKRGGDLRRFLGFSLAYNLGRIASYCLAGAFFGALGGYLSGDLLEMGGFLRGMAALVVMGIGLHLGGWFPRFAAVERFGDPIWRRLEPLSRHLLPIDSLPRATLYGALWGWLPCGLVYSMLLSSPAQGDSVAGALYMGAFGLGTLPVLVLTGLFASRVHHLSHHRALQTLSGLGIIALGLVTIVIQKAPFS